MNEHRLPLHISLATASLFFAMTAGAGPFPSSKTYCIRGPGTNSVSAWEIEFISSGGWSIGQCDGTVTTTTADTSATIVSKLINAIQDECGTTAVATSAPNCPSTDPSFTLDANFDYVLKLQPAASPPGTLPVGVTPGIAVTFNPAIYIVPEASNGLLLTSGLLSLIALTRRRLHCERPNSVRIAAAAHSTRTGSGT